MVFWPSKCLLGVLKNGTQTLTFLFYRNHIHSLLQTHPNPWQFFGEF